VTATPTRPQPGSHPNPARRTLAAFALASLFVLPTIASAAIVEKWHTGAGDTYRKINESFLNEDGVYKLITGEASGADEKIGIRSAATGALLAQSTLAYDVSAYYLLDVDGDGDLEIIVRDGNTWKFDCLDYTTGSSTLAVRWSYLMIAPGGQYELEFVDLDNTGHPYLVFNPAGTDSFLVYWGSNAASVARFRVAGDLGNGWSTHLIAANVDSDDKQELLIDFRASPNPNSSEYGPGGQDELWVFESTTALDVEPGVTDARSVALGPSYPNPSFSLSRIEYTLPTAGPVTLRLYDVTGRVVRTLVDGKVDAGRHQAEWDGRDAQGHTLPAGAYFYKLHAGGRSETRRVVRLH
jgi:hypothetical protein